MRCCEVLGDRVGGEKNTVKMLLVGNYDWRKMANAVSSTELLSSQPNTGKITEQICLEATYKHTNDKKLTWNSPRGFTEG